ncbi:hypothetical protein ACFV9C_41965 [Kribbella sp. NPDC059898]|uniref:hypothetical protein n=1 Tax=Kribbella sp. NPDC059898 TaxID=3346995 RepID=UPI003662C5BB
MTETATTTRGQLDQLAPAYGTEPAMGIVFDLWEGERLELTLNTGSTVRGYCVPSRDRLLVRVYTEATCDESAPGRLTIYSTAAVIGVQHLDTNPDYPHQTQLAG